MSGSDQGEFFWTVDGRYVFFFFRVHKVNLSKIKKKNSMLNYFSRMTE